MTGPQADGASPSSTAAKNSNRPRNALAGLAVLLFVGFIVRLTLAYVLLPASGFESDIGTFTAWALRLAEGGPGSFYATAGFADYPPGYLYVLWLVGGVGHMLAPLANTDAVSATTAMIKLPAIFADIVVGAILYFVARSWRSPRADAHRVGLFAAALLPVQPGHLVRLRDLGADGRLRGTDRARNRRGAGARQFGGRSRASRFWPRSSSRSSASCCCPSWASSCSAATSCGPDPGRATRSLPRPRCARGSRLSMGRGGSSRRRSWPWSS